MECKLNDSISRRSWFSVNSPSFSHQYKLCHGSLAVKHRRRKPAPYTEMALVLFMRLFVHISSHLMKESVSPVIHPESASAGSPSASSGSCSSDGRCTRCSSIRLAWTLCMRLKKSSSGTVGARGPPSGGEQRWSSILEDWTNRETDGEEEELERNWPALMSLT